MIDFLRLPLISLAIALASPLAAATFSFDLLGNEASIGEMSRHGLEEGISDPKTIADRLATDLRQTANLGGIENLMSKALLSDPDLDIARALLVIAKATNGDIKGANAVLAERPIDETNYGEDRIAKAIVARGSDDLGAARQLLEAVVNDHPEQAFAHNLLGTISVREGNLGAALGHFQEAVRQGPEGATYWANTGATLAQLGRLDEAQSALRAAIKINPEACATLIALAGLERSSKRYALAASHFQQCLGTAPTNAIAAKGLVVTEIEARNLDAAEVALKSFGSIILERDVFAAEIALRRGDKLGVDAALARFPSEYSDLSVGIQARRALLDGDTQSAADAFGRADQVQKTKPQIRAGLVALKIASMTPTSDAATGGQDPAVDAFYAGLSHLLVTDASRVDAYGYFKNAAGFIPGFRIDGLTQHDIVDDLSPEAAAGLAVPVYLLLTNTAGAAPKALRTLAEMHPNSALIEYLATYAAVLESQTPQLDLINAAVERAPDFFSGQLLYANLLLERDQSAMALAAYKKAADVLPLPSVLIRVGTLAESLNEDGIAEEAYREFAASEPNSFIALNQLAWFLASRNMKLDEAFGLAQTAAKLQPGNAAIEDTLGWIAYQRDDLETARRHLNSAITISSGRTPSIVLNLAQVEIAAGDSDRALRLLEGIGEKVVGSTLEQRLLELTAQATRRD